MERKTLICMIVVLWILVAVAMVYYHPPMEPDVDLEQQVMVIREMEAHELLDVEACGIAVDTKKAKIRLNVDSAIEALYAKRAIDKVEPYICASHDRIPNVTSDREGWQNTVQEWGYTNKIPEVCGYEEEVWGWLLENGGGECER